MYPAALLLALVLPFEVIPPLLATPWLALSDEKLVLLIAVGAWLCLGKQARPSTSEWRALGPSLGLLVVALLAALFAPEFGDEALRFVWRLAAAAFVLLLSIRVTRTRRWREGLLWGIVLGAGASALLGLGEASGWPIFRPLLDLFKVAPTRVAGEVRVSASFQYATIAAMYFEMVVPLAIVLAVTARRGRSRLVALGVGALCTANVVLSLTRAGMLALGLVLGLLLLTAWRRSEARSLAFPTLASAAVLLGGAAILAVRNPVFDMRLLSESDADWYGAVYSAPARLRLPGDQPVNVAVEVRNEGRLGWSSQAQHPFALGYRWLTGDGNGVLDVPAGTVALAHDVAPGETIRLQVDVAVPPLPPGTYRLDWGMLQRDVLKFYERGWADAETVVEIVPPAGGPPGGGGAEASPADVSAPDGTGRRGSADAAMPASAPRDDGLAPWVVGRLDLWRAALALVRTRPLLGVGPDNFRHLYGAQLGLETWDQRVQANNLYLEVLVDLGILGLAAFAWVVAEPLRRGADVLQLAPRRFARSLPGDAVARDRLAPDPVGRDPVALEVLVVLGTAAAVLAFLVHGVLDSFLAFTPTAWLFWMLLGLLLATQPPTQKPQVSGR